MKGFTIVELMVVVLIAGILAAVAVPMYRGRIDLAKWSEGKATMGSIALALRVYLQMEGNNYVPVPTLSDLGINPGVLNGAYFSGGDSGSGDFSWIISSYEPLGYLITATAPIGITTPSKVTLDASGQWISTP